MLALFLALIAGIATPTQTSVNNGLRSKIGSPYITSLISFGTATIWVFLALLVTTGGIDIPLAKIAEYPLWIWTGGLCGVVIVVPTVIAYPHLGSARMIMLLSFGQTMASLVIDNWGMFGSPLIKLNLIRIIGALVVILGVAMLSGFTDGSRTKAGESKRGDFIYVVLAFVSGIACALQVAINGTLGTVVEHSLKSALISMIIGTLGTATVVIVLLVFSKKSLYDRERVEIKFKWWMLMGGFLAFVLVSSNAASAPIIGAGLVTIMNLVGQMGMSLVVDGTGFLGIEKTPVTRSKLLGMILMIAGATLISLFG